MRRATREITDPQEILTLIGRCDTLRLGIADGEVPYIVPVSFGFEAKGSTVSFYIHGASAGRKHELLSREPRLAVEGDLCNGCLEAKPGAFTCDFESFMGEGKAVRLEGDAAAYGLDRIMEHCGFCAGAYDAKVVPITDVYRIDVERVSGKRRFAPGKRK